MVSEFVSEKEMFQTSSTHLPVNWKEQNRVEKTMINPAYDFSSK